MVKALSIFLLLFLLLAGAYAQEMMVVVQKRADSVGFYEAETGKPLATVTVGVKPHEMELSRDQRFAYITNYGVDSYTPKDPGGNTISIVDLAEQKKVGDIDLGQFHRPHGITMGRSGRLYVTTDFPPTLLVIDPMKRKIVQHYDVGQSLPHMVTLTPDEKKAYTANVGSATVTVISLGAGKALKHIPIGGIPMGPAMSADGSRLFVANRTGNAVVVIDTSKDEVVNKIEISGQPARLRFTPDGKHLLVSLMESGEVAVVDPASLQVKHRFPVGSHPEGVNIDPAGQFGYVSAQGDDKVVKFSLRDWKPVSEIKTGARPDPMVLLKHPMPTEK
jgi:YVTN family beta-propeller protein